MLKRFYYSFLIVIFFTAYSLQIACADENASTASSDVQGQQSFPFDKQCLEFYKANFKVDRALIDVVTGGDFPQYCVLYSLSNYKVKQRSDEGYFIIGSKSDPQNAQATVAFLKSKRVYQQNQVFVGSNVGDSKPVGQWAYFVGPEDFSQGNGSEKEIYVFQEIDF